MRRRRLAAFLAAVALAVVLAPVARSAGDGGATPPDAGAPAPRPGAARLAPVLASAPAEARLRAIATFDGGRPSEAQVDALRALGLTVQPLEHLPMALLAGTRVALGEVLARGLAADVYPDERIEWHWSTSNKAIGAHMAHTGGFTGKGVTVAVVDSGIDATHADLRDRVVHNVKLVGAEYANRHPRPDKKDADYVVVPVEQSPYNNSDIGSGHGTHVAGIIAADGTTSAKQRGVAPDAELVGYSIGEVAFTTAVVSAYDHILDNPRWSIDVVNNSWGNSYHFFDPRHPINLATRAVARTGVVVVFSAGNNGDDEAEATLNPWSQAPWVISVASGTLGLTRSSFSSNGLAIDNSQPLELVPGARGVRHRRFEGDRIGFLAPDITAPGTDIVSSGTPTGTLVHSGPNGTATASGTSMSGPHIAGAVAVLEQANPDLSPDQVRMALTATARPLADRTPYWRAGYGYADLAAAVDLVRRPDHADAIVQAQREADARVLADRDWKVLASDYWSFDASPVTAGGRPDARTFTVQVPPEAQGVKLTLAYPTAQGVVNWSLYDLVVTDGAGRAVEVEPVVARGSGTTSMLVDLAEVQAAPGTWKVRVVGELAASDPDTLDSDSLSGRRVELQVATLEAQRRHVVDQAPVFEPGPQATFLFHPDSGTGLPGPEGCRAEPAPTGGLDTAPLQGKGCEAGLMGYTMNRQLEEPAVFTSAPMPGDATFAGPGSLLLHLTGPGSGGFLDWSLAAVDRDDDERVVASGTVERVVAPPLATRRTLPLEAPPFTVPAGQKLRLTMRLSGVANSAVRLLFGEGHPSALTLTPGTLR